MTRLSEAAAAQAPGAPALRVEIKPSRRIAVFDTTLRDGEQSPGAAMGVSEKLAVARELLRLRVDAIEAGFPASSPGDAAAVAAVAAEIAASPRAEETAVCALARAVPADIDAAAAALAKATRPLVNTGIGVSATHMAQKLHMSASAVLDAAVAAVRHARRLFEDVQFYAEDAARADRDFLLRVLEAAVKAGATRIVVPDTTGCVLPASYGAMVADIMENVPGIDSIILSVHCHNDLGMATASTLAGLAAGACQAECTVNGIGERAGNAALEEVAMALALHGGDLGLHTGIATERIAHASRVVSAATGIGVQRNKAIVGANAFAHASGIHQDGVIKERSTYEAIDPASVGVHTSSIVLSARSGRAALRHRLEALGYTTPEDAFGQLYERFLAVADKKKEVYDDDLEALMAEHDRSLAGGWQLRILQVSCGTPLIATATVVLEGPGGGSQTAVASGTGPVDATFKAIDACMAHAAPTLQEFAVQAITRGSDALGEVRVRVTDADGRIFTGRGADGDIIVSSAKAYINALNRLQAN